MLCYVIYVQGEIKVLLLLLLLLLLIKLGKVFGVHMLQSKKFTNLTPQLVLILSRS